MTRLTKVGRAKAAEEGNTAAELPLPVNLLNTVLFATGLSCTDLLQKTALAQKILFFGFLLLGVGHLLLTVNQATKVGLLAGMALVERASVIRKFLWSAKVGI